MNENISDSTSTTGTAGTGASSDQDVIALLNELIATSKDGEKGFAIAAKDAKDPSLTILFSESEQSCRAAVAELQDQVRSLGGQAEEEGTMKAAIHRGWVSLKAATSSREDKAILEECEKGEDYAKAKYAAAVKQNLPAQVRTLLERQYQGVLANHDRVRDLRNQYAAR